MNTKIRSRTAFPRVLEETLYQAYQEGKTLSRFPSFCFPVSEQDRDQIILQAKSYSVVLDAKWRFGTVLFTAYIRH